MRVDGWCADLTRYPLPRGRFDLVVVCRYLQRDLFPALRDAVAPGGDRHLRDVHHARSGRWDGRRRHRITCSSRASCGERFDGFDLLFYEEVAAPDAVARLVARSRS